MKSFLRVATIAVMVGAVGAAVGQTTPNPNPDGRFHSQYDRMPDGGDFASNYPRGALNHSTPGIAVLCCSVREDRTLDCRVGLEWPQDQGFGAASLRIAEKFRLTPESYTNYASDPANWLQVPIIWVVDPPPREFQAIRQRISDGTQGLCRPAPQRPQGSEAPTESH